MVRRASSNDARWCGVKGIQQIAMITKTHAIVKKPTKMCAVPKIMNFSRECTIFFFLLSVFVAVVSVFCRLYASSMKIRNFANSEAIVALVQIMTITIIFNIAMPHFAHKAAVDHQHCQSLMCRRNTSNRTRVHWVQCIMIIIIIIIIYIITEHILSYLLIYIFIFGDVTRAINNERMYS